MPHFWQVFLVGAFGLGGGGVVGAVFWVVGFVLLSIDMSLSCMLNITMIASQISLQARLPRVSIASPPSTPPAPVEKPVMYGLIAAPTIITSAPIVMRIAPIM